MKRPKAKWQRKMRESFLATLSDDCITPEIALDVHRHPWKPNERVRIIVERTKREAGR